MEGVEGTGETSAAADRELEGGAGDQVTICHARLGPPREPEGPDPVSLDLGVQDPPFRNGAMPPPLLARHIFALRRGATSKFTRTC